MRVNLLNFNKFAKIQTFTTGELIFSKIDAKRNTIPSESSKRKQ